MHEVGAAIASRAVAGRARRRQAVNMPPGTHIAFIMALPEDWLVYAVPL